MDYQQLKQLVPKPPLKWNINDVATWLQFIGLGNFINSFKSHSIDGSCILSLEEQDLKDELEIKSGIIIKKIMAWIKTGLTEYQQYLIIQRDPIGSKFVPELGGLNDMGNNVEQQAQTLQKNITSENENLEFKNIKLQLFLQQLGTSEPNCIYINQGGAKIGRNNTNDVVIPESEVSRSHADITYNNNLFYLQDKGSVSGSFVKIVNQMQIKGGMCISIGSYLLTIQLLTSNRIKMLITSENGASIPFQRLFNGQFNLTIGKKATNDIVIQDDPSLHPNHANIYYSEGKHYARDLATTIGWLRLSPQGQYSQPYLLKDQSIIRIGPSMTYVCKIAYRDREDLPVQKSCAICFVNARDCVTTPCNHNSTCVKCCKNLKQCPICRIKIESFIRIYHK